MRRRGYRWEDAEGWAGPSGGGTELERLPVMFRMFAGIK